VNSGPTEWLPTGIEGLETVTRGGIPARSITLVHGGTGTGKTVLGGQFLAAGCEDGEPGVAVLFEEDPEAFLSHLSGFGWDLPGARARGDLCLVDARPEAVSRTETIGDYEFAGLVSRTKHAVEQVDADRVFLDAVNVLFERYGDPHAVRRAMASLSQVAREENVTILASNASTRSDPGSLHGPGVEKFVADALIVLRNRSDRENRRRTLEVLKIRGSDHEAREVPFSIRPGKGPILLPLSATKLTHAGFSSRGSTGTEKLDEMLGGGPFLGSTTLISGATGVGMTLMMTQFAHEGVRENERTLYLTFEESREQVLENAEGIDHDLTPHTGELLRLISTYPGARSLPEHLLDIKDEVEAFEPERLVLDTVSSLAYTAGERSFREFLIGLNDLTKDKELLTWYGMMEPVFEPPFSVHKGHLSAISDTILLLRYLETDEEIKRIFTVLKMRGSDHDPSVREIEISDEGLGLGSKVEGQGILRGIASPNDSGPP